MGLFKTTMPVFLAGDCNACFSQIVEQKTFGKLTPDEMNIFYIPKGRNSKKLNFGKFFDQICIAKM